LPGKDRKFNQNLGKKVSKWEVTFFRVPSHNRERKKNGWVGAGLKKPRWKKKTPKNGFLSTVRNRPPLKRESNSLSNFPPGRGKGKRTTVGGQCI